MSEKECADGFISLLDGMNSGLEPALLSDYSYAKGINVSSRRGFVHTRPGFVKEPVTLASGTFQGAGRWSLNSGDRLVYVIGGQLYAYSIQSAAIVSFGLKFVDSGQCYFCQADRYFIVQDGESPPVVLEEDSTGAPVITSDVVGIPIGTIMSYAHGRLHEVPKYVPGTTESGKPYFISGDVIKANAPQDVLKFTESGYWNEGGAHGLPQELGFITAMGPMRNAATGTGVGSHIVMARNGMSAFDLSIARSQWNSTQLAQLLFAGPGSGTLSPFSVISVNDDLIYRGVDGLRTVKYASTALSGGAGALSNVPISNDVSIYMDNEPQAFLPYVSADFCDNRVLYTCSGTDSRYFRGLISLDVAQVYAMRQVEDPSFDGLWTGGTFAQVIVADRDRKPYVFVFTKTPALYRLEPNAKMDVETKKIVSRLETRVMSFTQEYAIYTKRLKFVELWVSDLYHDVFFEIFYRPGGYPLWATLGSKIVRVGANSMPQRRRKIRISLDKPGAFCDPATHEVLDKATDFQFCIRWTGYAKIEKFTVRASADIDAPQTACSEAEAVDITEGGTAGISLDDYEYVFEPSEVA